MLQVFHFYFNFSAFEKKGSIYFIYNYTIRIQFYGGERKKLMNYKEEGKDRQHLFKIIICTTQ